MTPDEYRALPTRERAQVAYATLKDHGLYQPGMKPRELTDDEIALIDAPWPTERERIVAWLRAGDDREWRSREWQRTANWLADAIERGEHLK